MNDLSGPDAPRLEILRGGVRMAELRRVPGGTELHPLPDASESRCTPPGISLHLPNREAASFGHDLPAFLANLLPEGLRFNALVRGLRTSPSDGFTLLGGLQTDVIGDFWAQRTDAQPHPPSEIDLDSEDALERLYADQTLIATGLPGVQPKLSLTSLSRSLRRNAIVKFAPPEFPLLVENEAYWLRACSRLRLRAVKAKVRIGKRGFHRLEVDRFDREKGGGRLHTEDGCQIMNLHPADKYQVSWHSLIEAASRVCSAPLPAALHWMHLHLVSWLCGNADLHAKNISVVVAGGVIQPSPVYDVVCTLAYPGLAPQMALKSLGKDDGYRLRDFEELAARLGLPRRPVESMIRRSLDLMPDLVKGFRTSVPYDDATHDRIERILLERWQRLSGSIS